MLAVRLLGQFDVRRDGTPIAIPSRPAQSLFAFLLLNAGVAHRRELLAGLLWPDTTEDNARGNLRTALWHLRDALEPKQPRGRAVKYIISDEISIAIDTHAEYWLDASALERAGVDASGRDLIAALSLYRGELLPGFYDNWVVFERERLHGIFEQKMERLLDRLVAEERWSEVREWSERWIAFGQAPEPAYRALMRFHHQAGAMSQVALVYKRCEESLREFGVEPSEQTRALLKELMSGEPTKKQESAPPPKTQATTFKPPVQSKPRLEKSATTEPPTGTVTFLFTDIEGSTTLWEKHPDVMKIAIARHDALVRDAVERNRGYVFKTVGDGFCAAFPTAVDGLNAAVAAQRSLQAEDWGEIMIKARMALHTGSVEERESDYFGRAVNRVARLLSAGHGGQILISRATTELVRDQLPENVSLRDLGERRLKDLDRPEHIYQLVVPDLPSDFPPPKTHGPFPNNLRLQLTSFIGREREIAEVMRLLSTTRLLTLTGAGGVGKTRLALEVGADLLDRFSDGVWLIELASLSDATLVAQTILAALGLHEQAAPSLEDTLLDHLREKNLLLILDNCEHMLEACARLAFTLLSTCAHLKIMATSQHTMHIGGEMVWPVPPLSLESQPTPEDSTGSEAVRLFVERAQFILPAFRITAANEKTVTQICRRLDGLPLAIELAAARVDILSPEEINKGMDDRFRLLTGGGQADLKRHQTLRACVDWSWNLLSADERVLFRRLAVFAGTWTLEDVEQVCSDDGLAQVLDLLASLVRKSLVNVEAREGVSRYRLLETPRLYALERLRVSGEVERLSAQHRDWYLHLAEAFESETREKKQTSDWIARLGSELDNLRAALEWSQKEAGGAGKGLRLSGALGKFWEKQNALTEGREWLGKFLDLAKNSPDAIARARALYAAGRLAHLQGEDAQAITYYDQCLKIEAQDTALLAETHLDLGYAFYRRADYDSAAKHYDQAIQLGETVHDSVVVALAQMRLGMIYHEHGDLERAIASHRLSLEEFKKAGDLSLAAAALGNLARIHYQRTEHEQAIEYYTQVIQTFEGLEKYYSLCVNYINLSEIHIDRGNYAEANEFLNKCLQLAERLGNNYMKAVAWGDVAICKLNQGEPELALDYALRALELIHKVQAKDQEGVIYRKLGEIRTLLGQREEAQREFQVAQKILEPLKRKSELARLYRSYGKFLMSEASTRAQGVENLERALAMFQALGSTKEVENTKMLLHGAVNKLS